MALLNKIFSLRKKNVKNTENTSAWNGLNFSENQVRILLFRECEFQGRKLLFDSKAIHKVSVDKPTKLELEKCTGEGRNQSYVCKKGVSNVKSCSELTAHSSNNVKFSNSLENVSKHSNLKAEELSNQTIHNKKTEDVTQVNSLVEIANTFEYQLARPDVDVTSLGEIIFGSVALTYRGTSLKIHKLENDISVHKEPCYSDSLLRNTGPAKLNPKKNVENRKPSDNLKKIMCTHIFCPPVRPVKQSVASSKVNQNVSSFSSVVNDCTVNSDSSDIKVGSTSYPLDVPRVNSTEGDSGCSAGEQSSYSSISSGGPPSFLYYFDRNSNLNNAQNSFEGSTINMNRCWTRNINMSLDYWPSMSSVPNESCSSTIQSDSFNSSHGWSDNHVGLSFRSESGRRYSSGTEDSLNNSSNHGRRSKLGLAVIIDLIEHEVELEQYLFENMTLLETMLWRLRDCVYHAYWRRHSFLSIMVEGSLKSALWLRDVLCPSVPPPKSLCFHQLVNDNNLSSSQEEYLKFNNSCSISDNVQNKTYDLFWKGWFKTDKEPLNEVNWKYESIEYFVKELCDLIATIDTKTTNFFLSALITAVLSNHLGWVIPYIGVTTNEISCSALWVQLIEMYGVVGNPARLAHTIITGQPVQKEQMIRISNILVYFIRYCEIERNLEKKVNITTDEYINNAMENITIGTPSEKKSHPTTHGNKLNNLDTIQPQTLKSNDMEMTVLSGCGRNGNFKDNTIEETLFEAGDEIQQDIGSIYESYYNKLMKIFCTNCLKQITDLKTKKCLEADILCNHCLLLYNNDTSVQIFLKKFLRIQYSTILENKNAFFVNSTDNIFVDFIHDKWTSSKINQNSTKLNNSSGNAQLIKCDKGSVEENVNSDNKSVSNETNKSSLRRTKSYVRDVNQDNLKYIDNDLNKFSESSVQLDSFHKPFVSESNKLEQINNNLQISEISIKHSELFSPIKENDIVLSNDLDKSENIYRATIVDQTEEKENVVFVLGDNEQLVGLKSSNKNEGFRDTNVENTLTKSFVCNQSVSCVSASSCVNDDNSIERNLIKKDHTPVLDKRKKNLNKLIEKLPQTSSKSDFQRSQSVPPEDSMKSKCIKYCKNCHHSNKYSGVKFNFEQYPQIATKYMLSNNLEIENHPLFVEKGIQMNRSVSINFDDLMKISPTESCTGCKCSEMILQTPSNASELQFSSSLVQENNDQIHNKNLDSSPEKFISNNQMDETGVERYPATKINYFDTSITHPSTSKLCSIDNKENSDVNKTYCGISNDTSDKTVLNLLSNGVNKNLTKSIETCSEEVLNISSDLQDSVNVTKSFLKNDKSILKEECSMNNILIKQDICNLESKRYFVNNTKIEEHPLSVKNNGIEYAVNDEDIFAFSDTISNSIDNEHFITADNTTELNVIELPMPKSHPTTVSPAMPLAGYSHRLIRAGIVGSHYISGAVLQATTEPIASWMSALRRDLALAVRHSPLDQPVVEALCIVADVDKCDVQILSNHSNIVPSLVVHQRKDSSYLQGAPVGPSHLVADMLESVLQLWKLHTPAKYCLQHIENQLHEFYVRSFALSELLIATDFCDMAFLTSTLGIHPNDVPLLLAVASTHTPQVTQKYSVSFQ